MKTGEINPSSFQVESYPGESLSNFLGRFRRANDLTTTGLAKAAGVGGAISLYGKSFVLILLLLGNS
jgi:hypothetical protein